MSYIVALLLSNAVASRRDLSIYYNRTLAFILFNSCILALYSIKVISLNKGIGLYGGLFNSTPVSNTFHIFIFLLTSVIILVTSFYPRKV